MKNDHPYVGAASIFLDDTGRILLMKRSEQSKTHAGRWGLVGGFLEWNETGEEAAIREAKEEIGVDIEIERFIGRYYNTPHPTKSNLISLIHYSKIISGTPHPAQPEECSEVKWFEPKEVKKLDMAYDHREILENEGLI